MTGKELDILFQIHRIILHENNPVIQSLYMVSYEDRLCIPRNNRILVAAIGILCFLLLSVVWTFFRGKTLDEIAKHQILRVLSDIITKMDSSKNSLK